MIPLFHSRFRFPFLNARFRVLASGVFILLLMIAPLSATPWEKLSDDEALALGWSRVKLTAAKEYASTIKTEAVMIIANGKILDQWGSVDQKFNVHSIRKSFLSALYGSGVTEGNIHLDATMADLKIDDNPPPLTTEEKQATVLDLLKARSGIYHAALYETAKMKERRPDRYSHKPGTFWYYNNWDFNALGTIYENACGGIYENFKHQIADPLGMEDYEVKDGHYVTGTDSIHRAYPFRMTARDMARFGQLYLQNGNWEGRQIIPAEWVRDSVTSYSNAGDSGGYGYLWWIAARGKHLPGVSLSDGSYSARGAGGHYILIVPERELVIVHRVNTNIRDRRVESSEFGKLVSLILAAHQIP